MIGPAIGQDEAPLMLLSPTRSSRAGYSRQATRRTAFASPMRGDVEGWLPVGLTRRSRARRLHSLKERIVGQSHNGKHGGCC